MHKSFGIQLSFIFALILTILPLPYWAEVIRPAWLPLVLIYWAIALPHRVGIASAWLLGIACDLLLGSLFGAHAFALSTIVYLAIKFHKQMRVFPLIQQAVCICLLVFFYQAQLILFQLMAGQQILVNLAVVSAFSSMALWPLLFIVLRDWRRRWRIA